MNLLINTMLSDFVIPVVFKEAKLNDDWKQSKNKYIDFKGLFVPQLLKSYGE